MPRPTLLATFSLLIAPRALLAAAQHCYPLAPAQEVRKKSKEVAKKSRNKSPAQIQRDFL